MVKHKKIITFLVFFLALFLILFRFTEIPRVWVDEAVFTEVSRNLVYHNTLAIQTEPENFYKVSGFVLSTSYPVIFPVALSMKLFGIGVLQTRLPMVMYMFLFVVISFLFVRKKYGDYPAIISIFFIISFAPFYGNGRPVQGEVPGLFFTVLGLYLLLFLEESSFINLYFAFFSGLAFGFASATKALYMTFLPVSFIVALFFCYKKIQNKKTILYFILGFILPMILWFFVNFSLSTSIFSIVSSYLYFAGNHGSNSGIVINFLRFFKESTPILFGILSISIIFSFIFRYKKEKIHSFSITEIIIACFIFLNWLGYLNGTGWYRYFFPANTLLYILFPGAVIYISLYFKNGYYKKYASYLLVVLVVLQFYHLFFLSDLEFTKRRITNTELSSALNNIPENKNIFFYNTIEGLILYKGQNYSQYLSMEDFVVAGDKNYMDKPTADFILTYTDPSGSLGLSCYKQTIIGSYYLEERIPNCKNR